VALSQKRYLPIGSTGSHDQSWQVPVCVRYPAAGGMEKECFLLDKPAAEFRLARARSCPAYLSANDEAAGYYVANYRGGLLPGVLEHGRDFLDAAERRTTLHDLELLAAAGDAKESEALSAAAAFAGAAERQVVEEAESAVAGIERLVPPELLPNYRRFIAGTFGKRAEALGWSPKPGEDAETALLRNSLVPFVATTGEDTALQAEARRLADRWLRDRSGISPEILRGVLTTAAYAGGRPLFDKLLETLKTTQDRHLRNSILAALGSFRDPAIARASLDLLIHSDLDTKETLFPLLMGPLGTPETERLPFAFVQANYEQLLKRLPTGGGFDAAAMLPFVGQGLCDESSRKEFTAFFEERSKKATGGPRNFAQAVEGIKLCEAQKTAQSADVAEFLKRQ
jgi:alanyl aminopeptidase